LLRYGHANGDGFVDVIDTLTLYPRRSSQGGAAPDEIDAPVTSQTRENKRGFEWRARHLGVRAAARLARREHQ
jgi:hypothetical protein